ncbi:MAG: hypothetical protein A2X48_16230 [Lentisphaerae bacterium GWF2_49_21]|nr:MAG: hypothetical protein A2X48_16230 [Lentisphaerae bacterium GWF2_49_21]
MLKKTCLVVPCYNEENRLNIDEYRKFSGSIDFLFVNDGSTDGTLKLLQDKVPGFASVLNLEKNSGKAEAVRRGMMHLKNLPFYDEIEWTGFWDADLATPLEELECMHKFKDDTAPDAVAVFGIRIRRPGNDIRRSQMRHIISRIFCLVFRMLYGIKTYDSQCGAKIFRKEIVEKAFSEPFSSRWIFDVELIIRLKGSRILEYPVRKWTDIKGSTIMRPGNVLVILSDIFKLWKKYA